MINVFEDFVKGCLKKRSMLYGVTTLIVFFGSALFYSLKYAFFYFLLSIFILEIGTYLYKYLLEKWKKKKHEWNVNNKFKKIDNSDKIELAKFYRGDKDPYSVNDFAYLNASSKIVLSLQERCIISKCEFSWPRKLTLYKIDPKIKELLIKELENKRKTI